MRLIAFLVTLLALAAAVFAGDRLWNIWTAPSAGDIAQTANLPQPVAGGIDGAEPVAPHQWKPVFGELQPPAPPEPEPAPPPAPPPPAPQPQPPAPPIESLGYTLKGVVRAGDAVWGLVSHPTGDRVLRVGDELEDDITIARIDEQGLWVDNGGDAPVLLGFAQEDDTDG